MPSQVGSTLADRYVLDALAGEGASAKVYRATDKRTQKTVAVKVLAAIDGVAHDTRWLARELKALAVLDHPNVVRMLDADPEAEEPWLCTEWLEGSDLQTLVAEHGPLPEAAVVGVALGALAGLDAAHALTILHRDLKPANIFVCKNGRIVLLDFGVARATSDAAGKTLAGRANTSVVGTPTYLPPELLREEPATLAGDLYSLGLTLRFLVTGEQPFAATTMLELMRQIVNGQMVPLPQSVNGELATLLGSMTHADPGARLGSAKRARAAFLALSQKLPRFSETFERFCQRAEETTSVRSMRFDVRSGEGTQIQTITVKVGDDTHSGRTQIATAPSTRLSTAPSTGPVRKRRRFVGASIIAAIALIVCGAALLLTRKSASPPPLSSSQVQLPPPREAQTDLPAPAAPAQIDVAPPPIEPPPQQRVAPEPPKSATLQLSLKQWANVKIDGKDQGRRQLSARFELPAGKHHIVVENPSYGERVFDPNLRAGQTHSIDVDFKQ